jgi:hypothetical protein
LLGLPAWVSKRVDVEMSRPVVELEPWEYEWVAHVGARRYIENWGKLDAAHYDRSRMEDDRTAQVAAAACELAVAKWTNSYWSGHVWKAVDHERRKNLPDVGKNIEVRRLRTRETAALRKSQLAKNLVLFVAKPVMPEIRAVEIYGWIMYDKGWTLAEPADYDPENTRLLQPHHLRLDR